MRWDILTAVSIMIVVLYHVKSVVSHMETSMFEKMLAVSSGYKGTLSNSQNILKKPKSVASHLKKTTNMICLPWI
jgi:hypothetical protein